MGEDRIAGPRAVGHEKVRRQNAPQSLVVPERGTSPRRGSNRNQALGRLGEDLAVRYLEALGYCVRDRNWRCRHGEIDIVALCGEQLAFVEVKTRSSNNFGHPFEAISPAKLHRMHLLARLWRAEHPGDGSSARLDVIGIVAPAGRKPVIQHLRGVHA